MVSVYFGGEVAEGKNSRISDWASLLFSDFDNVLSQMSAGERWLVQMHHSYGRFFPAVSDTSLCG